METQERPPSEVRYERYRAREAEDGSLVVYDEENDDAWVRSDRTTEPTR